MSSPIPEKLAALSAYAIDPRTGFIPATDPIARLPPAFDAWERLVPELSALIRSRRLREALRELPLLNPMTLASSPERERALLLLTVFANGWVWGDTRVDLTIPKQISVPLCALARDLDRPPIVHYASMALNNWQRLDRRLPVSDDNARMQVQFLGGVDEDWFFIGSLGVELAGVPLIESVHGAALASLADDDHALANWLARIAHGMTPVLTALERMRTWCDPHIFYHRVRPFLAGWPAPGAIYEGVDAIPRKYVGGSAGQSSLIQALDALLGIEHAGATGDYLRDVRRYMPTGHRRFVHDVAATTQARSRAGSGSPQLRSAYNDAVRQIDQFRQAHIRLARDYIFAPSGGAAGSQGTGGTTFVDFLGDAQRQTAGSTISASTVQPR